MARHLEAIFPLLWETGDERKQVPVPALQKTGYSLMCHCYKRVQ